MTYADGTTIETGDKIEVEEEGYEAETATVLKIGKKALFIEWDNLHITPRKAWVYPDFCELIAREG